MKTLLLAVCVLLCPFSSALATKSSSEVVEARFVKDYIEFYHISRVCVVATEYTHWTREMVLHLSALPLAYISVVDFTIPEESNGTQTLQSRLAMCQGLRILRFDTTTEKDLFEKVFVGSQTHEKWLLISQNISLDDDLQFLYFPLNNQVMVSVFSPERQTATLWEVYQINDKLKQRLMRVGYWISTGEHKITRTTYERPDIEAVTRALSIPDTRYTGSQRFERNVKQLQYGILEAPVSDRLFRRRDLTGLHLTCTTIMYKPLTTLRDKPGGGVLIDGLYGKVFQTLQELTNFTYRCHRVKDGQWGSVVDGKWTGMIKEVADGTADIAIAPLSITHLRSTASDFLYGLSVSGFRIVMKRPSNEDYMWSVYTKQFDSDTWGVLALIALALVCSLYFASRWSSPLNLSLVDSFFVVIGIIFGQGTKQTISTLSFRTVLLTVMLLQVMILAFYNSNLVSALTVGPPMPAMEDLQDIYNNPSITFGFVKSSSVSDKLNTATPLHQAILQRVSEEDLVNSPSEGMERVKGGDYAFMVWELFYTLNYGNDCGTFLLPASYFPGYTSFAMTKGSSLAPLFNTIVMEIQSVGLMRKWWQELRIDSNCDNLETAPVNLKTVLTPFLLLAISILLSLGILVAEIYVSLKKI